MVIKISGFVLCFLSFWNRFVELFNNLFVVYCLILLLECQFACKFYWHIQLIIIIRMFNLLVFWTRISRLGCLTLMICWIDKCFKVMQIKRWFTWADHFLTGRWVIPVHLETLILVYQLHWNPLTKLYILINFIGHKWLSIWIN